MLQRKRMRLRLWMWMWMWIWIKQALTHTLAILLQVSTPTGIISHFVNLQVVVPEAFILGSGELHVDMGSTINLVCIIEKVSLANHCTIAGNLHTKCHAAYAQYFTSLSLSPSPSRAPHHRSTCTGRRTIGWSTTTTRGGTSRLRPHRGRAPRAGSSYASRKSPTPATTPAPPATPSQQAFTSLYQKVRESQRAQRGFNSCCKLPQLQGTAGGVACCTLQLHAICIMGLPRGQIEFLVILAFK